jgi:YHS domain-containing protein
MMRMIKTMMAVTFVALCASGVSAQKAFVNKDNVANNGYDVVNYFTANSAVRGGSEFSMIHNGATYYFVSAEHLNAFKAAPQKYLPQYDGYCAFAVAKMNQKVSVNPETFRIDDGKLYLFYNDFWEGKPLNTIVPWINNEAEMEKMAAENWRTLKSN